MLHLNRRSGQALLAALVLAALPHKPAQAQARTIASLGGDLHGGYAATSGLVSDHSGKLWGVAPYGGNADRGAVYATTQSGTVTLIHSFGDGTVKNDGVEPTGTLLLASDGNFYGTTYSGGSTTATDPQGAGYGVVYKITPSGQYTVLHSFGDGTVKSDGRKPWGGLIEGADGSLYGTTVFGGGTLNKPAGCLGYGVAYRITPTGSVTILHSFADGSVAGDGANPFAGLTLNSDRTLFFGATLAGGSTRTSSYPGSGTLYSISAAGKVKILHSFADGSIANDGAGPAGAVTVTDSNVVYGTAQYGGVGGGVVFAYSATAGYTVLHTFWDGTVANDGWDPYAALTLGDDGSLYGTANHGGSNNSGAVFSITPGGAVTILHSFQDGSTTSDGQYPLSPVTQIDPGSSFVNLFGTTQTGGVSGYGAVYEIGAPTQSTVRATFTIANAPASGSQKVYVVGDIAALGSWSPASGFPLSPQGGGVWSGVATLPASTAARYKYVVYDGATATWEADQQNGDINRTITTPAVGQAEYDDGSFLAKNASIPVTFEALNPPVTSSHQHVYVVGDNAVLGNWSPSSALQMVKHIDHLDTKYSITINLPASLKAQYKYIVSDGTTTIWEADLPAIKNHQLTVPYGSSALAADGNFYRPHPYPMYSAVSPASLPTGTSAQTITVSGDGFDETSRVLWNGTALATTFVSSSTITATVPASDLSKPATASIAVANPQPFGGVSLALPYSVEP